MTDQHAEPPRIERALAVFLSFTEGELDLTREQLLDRYEDVRDLLAPMLSAACPEASSATSERVLGEFRLLREIGRGGMGIVYEAHQPSLDRRVAVKSITAAGNLHPASLARFKREALTMARLDHSGIVRVLDVGSQDDEHYFVMELVEGESLERRITRWRDGSLTTDAYVREVIAIVAEVCDALEYAHRLGIVHRDVKPSNILIRPNGRAVLVDFGLAWEGNVPSLTATGMAIGTPHYMSPEQVRGEELDARSDVFALGATLYEALTLERPFPGDRPEQILANILMRDPVDPRRRKRELSSEIAAVVMKALEKEPLGRYPSAAAFGADLRAFLEYRPVLARRPSAIVRIVRWAKRERLKATMVSALLLVVPILLLLLGYVLAKQGEIRAGHEKMARDRLQSLLDEGYYEVTFGETARAEVAFLEALALSPESVPALGGMAILVDRTRGHLAAAEYLAEHRHLVDCSQGLLRLELLLLRAGGRTADVERLKSKLGPLENSDDYFFASREAVLRMDDGDPTALREALVLASLAVRFGERNSVSYATQWLLCAETLEDLDELREIARWFDMIPSNSANVLNMHALAWKRFDLPRARALMERAVALAPQDASMVYNLGLVHDAAGDVERARRAFERACELDEHSMDAWNMLVQEYVRASDLDAAAKACDRCIALDPGSGLAHFNRARVQALLGNQAERDASARKAVELEPLDPYHSNELGCCLRDQGEVGNARVAFERAVRLGPTLGFVHRNLCSTLHRLGDWTALLEELRRWASQNPGDREAWMELARFHLDRLDEGHADPEAAKEIARKVLGLDGVDLRECLEILTTR